MQDRLGHSFIENNPNGLSNGKTVAQGASGSGSSQHGASSLASDLFSELGEASHITPDKLENWLSEAGQGESAIEDSRADAFEEDAPASQSDLTRRSVSDHLAADADNDKLESPSKIQVLKTNKQHEESTAKESEEERAASEFFFRPAKDWVTSVLRIPKAAAATAAPPFHENEELRRREDMPRHSRNGWRGRIHW